MKMMVSADRAAKLLNDIPHNTCRSAIRTQWRCDERPATAASFLWLYCWAMTGMNSDKAKAVARDAFDEIFGLRVDEVAARLPHDWARRGRYRDDLADEEIIRSLGD